MNKQHIPGFFDALVRTPAFLFLCAMFLCGALAGGLTGLHAGEGDSALTLAALLSELPRQAFYGVLCAVVWLALPLLCAPLRAAPLLIIDRGADAAAPAPPGISRIRSGSPRDGRRSPRRAGP